MDLFTIQKKIEGNKYEWLIDFECDVKLVIENCRYYNASWTPICKNVSKIEEVFDQEWETIISSKPETPQILKKENEIKVETSSEGPKIKLKLVFYFFFFFKFLILNFFFFK